MTDASTSALTSDLISDLAGVVGDAHVLVDPALRAPFESDWTRRWSGEAGCVVRPGSTEQVAAVVGLARSHGVPVVTQGGNTGLVGGAVPSRGAIVVSTTRLDRLEAVDEVARQVTVGAGVTLEQLHGHAARSGLGYGVDLAARASATVGGTLATNAGGVRVVRYGTTRRQVLGVEAVLADGGVLSRLSGLEKDNVGYDLPGLLVGSEGTLGIITRARLRLIRPPTHRVAALLALDSTETAVHVTTRLRDLLDGLDAVELMYEPGVALVREHAGVASPFPGQHPVLLLVEVAADEDPTDRLAGVLDEADGLRDVAVATDAPARARLWRLREAHTEAISAAGVAHKLDVSLPLARLADLVAALPAIVAEAARDARLIVFGHLGDGNLHVNVLGPDPDDPAVDDAILGAVVSLGGAISGEHGIGRHKVAHVSSARGAADLAAMRAIRAALDPSGLFNPGVLLPGS